MNVNDKKFDKLKTESNSKKKVKESTSEDSSDDDVEKPQIKVPPNKTNKPVIPKKPASSDSDSSDDSDAAQKLPQSTPITKPQKKQEVKTAPVSKQLSAKKQPAVAAKQTNESSDSSDDDEDNTVKSKTSKPDAKVENKKVINF